MNILNLIPDFNYMEVNNLTGLRTGQVLSQFESGELGGLVKTVGKTEYVENGCIVTLSKDAKIVPFDSTSNGQPFVHFTEPLNTVVDKLSAFAVPKKDILRCVGLYLGDSFTTNNVDVNATSKPVAAKVVAGKITLEDAASAESIFSVVVGTMPDGSKGYELTYVGKHEIA